MSPAELFVHRYVCLNGQPVAEVEFRLQIDGPQAVPSIHVITLGGEQRETAVNLKGQGMIEAMARDLLKCPVTLNRLDEALDDANPGLVEAEYRARQSQAPAQIL